MIDLLLGRRTPLAFRNLTSQPRRMLASLAGVVFAIALMFMQRGFQRSLLDSTVALLDRIDGDAVILGKTRFSLVVRERFPRTRLNAAAGVEGVARVRPLTIENNLGTWKNVDTGVLRPMRTIGVDPTDIPLAIPEVIGQAGLLSESGAILVDRRSKRVYGPMAEGTRSELARKAVRVVGRFSLGTDFASNGSAIISEVNYSRLFPEPTGAGRPSRVDFGVVSLAAGADLQQTIERLRQRLPEDVRVLSKAELIRRERQFWERNTPIGYIFGFGTVMGVVVGMVISYQILYSDVVEHLKEFATLKAIGYQNRTLAMVVAQQALLVAAIAFAPAWLLSAGLYRAIESATGLLMQMNLVDSMAIFALSAGMCVFSGALATRRLFSADPAELF